MDGRTKTFHAAVDFEGAAKKIVFAALTNSIVEVGAQWLTWKDNVIQVSLVHSPGTIGAKFALHANEAINRNCGEGLGNSVPSNSLHVKSFVQRNCPRSEISNK
jgi:hypothetical protein